MTRRRGYVVAAATVAAVLLGGCSGTPEAVEPREPAASDRGTASSHGDVDAHAAHDAAVEDVAPVALRAGERFERLRMPSAYTPSAPYGEGTDDYRCFVLDPDLQRDAWITGIDVEPGAADVVHHVILFRVPPEQVGAAEAKDAADGGEGWTCFSGTGLEGGVGDLDRAPWLGAWAPGGSETVMADDVGVPLEKGSRVVMQVHYNLLAGAEPDRTAARLRLARGSVPLEPLETMLLPAPVELPCRPGRDGRLCDRDDAIDDVASRFGEQARFMVDGLHVLCGGDPVGPTQSCTRTVDRPTTVRAAAGHMHLLGASVTVEANPGTPRARTLLDVPVWNFDDQGSRALDRPARLRAGDSVEVTCTWDRDLRDRLPSFRGTEERYVVWGEGTTDEMCLGILLVTEG